VDGGHCRAWQRPVTRAPAFPGRECWR
jgi:hypothetical protein